eukprot:356731-Chlamydomonas_euryale.AAC.3
MIACETETQAVLHALSESPRGQMGLHARLSSLARDVPGIPLVHLWIPNSVPQILECPTHPKPRQASKGRYERAAGIHPGMRDVTLGPHFVPYHAVPQVWPRHCKRVKNEDAAWIIKAEQPGTACVRAPGVRNHLWLCMLQHAQLAFSRAGRDTSFPRNYS